MRPGFNISDLLPLSVKMGGSPKKNQGDYLEDKICQYKVKTYNNSDNELMGLTIKGKSKDFLRSHGELKQIIREGKNLFLKNEKIKVLNHTVLKNMTVSIIEVGTDDQSGQAELKIYNVSQNRKRGATIEIRRETNSSFENVKILKDLITSFLDECMENQVENDGFSVCKICGWKSKVKTRFVKHMKNLHGSSKLNCE